MSSEFLNVLASGVFAPKPPKPRQWLSVNGVRFHLEKPASQAAGRNWFESLCGFTGDCNEERFDGETFLQCAECVQISSSNILDVADQGRSTTELTESITVGSGGEVPDGASPLQDSQVIALSLGYSGPLAEIPVIDQSLEARKLICGLSQGDTALMRVADTQEVASPSSLPVPLGREGGDGLNVCVPANGAVAQGKVSEQKSSDLEQEPPKLRVAGSNPASLTIFSYFPLAEIVEKVFKQRSFLCN